MKLYKLLLIPLLMGNIPAYSQVLDETIIEKTPWGQNVTTYVNFEATDSDRAYGDSYYQNYTNGTYLYYWPPYSSSDRFNCHGYAWYMSNPAGGSGKDDPRAISRTNNSIPYIQDGISYKQVYSEAEADIVWWTTTDHSAVTTQTPWVWISKFHFGPLVQHAWNDTPYGTSGLEYYKRCFYRRSGFLTTNNTYEECKAEYVDIEIANSTSITIEYEDWILISGEFETGSGSTLDIHPK